MTLSDPLLKELKGHIAKLVLGKSPPYGDENENVFLLCHCVESIFLKGLIRHDGFTPWKTDSFSFFYQLVRKYRMVIPLSFKLAFEEVLNDPKTRTQTGKTRLLIRNCMKRRCLHIPLQFHVENQDYGDSNLRINYKPTSIMGHEILSQIFLSLIMQLSHYEFTFDLSNSSFLDESWQIPQLLKAEFVPCEKLGLTLAFPLGYAVIADIIDNSLAAEIGDKIAVGDIMDEFNGISVRNYYGSKIESLFRKNRTKPFKITFVKATDCGGQLYLPAIKLYRILGLDPERLTYSKTKDTPPNNLDEFDLELNKDSKVDQLDVLKENDSMHASGIEQPTTTLLIQGLLQEEFENEDKIPYSESKSKHEDTVNISNIQSIMDEFTNSSTVDDNKEAITPEKINILSSELLELDLDFNIPCFDDLDTRPGNKFKGIETNEIDSVNESIPIPENCDNDNEKSVFEKQYYDDTNPCMV